MPETSLLPLLAKLFNCSIDSILMPLAARDSKFRGFVRDADSIYAELATQLYHRLNDKFDFTVTYNDKYYIFEAVYSGGSALFNIPGKEDFIIRMDVEKGATAAGDNNLAVRISLTNCSGYIHLVDEMPEHIKRVFRVSDCKSCTCNCPYCMNYSFEGVEYKQCHYITIYLNSIENMEHILTLAYAENEKFVSDIKRSK